MDREGKPEGSSANDPKLNREKNQGTGTKTTDQQPQRKNPFDMEDNAKAE
jgi:hypothetical protein